MTDYVGWTDQDGNITHVYDGSGCFDSITGKCYCADCFYYGEENVNCSYAGAGINDGAKPVKWDGSKWVLDT